MTILLIILILILLYTLYRYYLSDNNIKDTSKELIDKINKYKKEKELLEEEIKEKEKYMQTIQGKIEGFNLTVDNLQETWESACENYEKILNYKYQETETEYDNNIELLSEAFDNAQDKILEELNKQRNELNKIKATKEAAIEALKKEQEIKEQLAFYCINITELEKDDIVALEKIKPQLHQPRILCMLIWSTFFQKPMTNLCNNVLGTKQITGIYKITNQKTEQCYIGQAVDVAKRWKEHAKCGLGIDAPAGNKLYRSMEEYGLWNFSWELLEECPRDLLNEKEAFYIDLYDSKNYGFNNANGIKKN